MTKPSTMFTDRVLRGGTRHTDLDRDTVHVLQSIGAWLAHTMVWLFDQTTSLDRDVDSHVVCERSCNLDRFHVPNIHCLAAEYRWRTLWDRTLRKAEIRHHLGVKQSVLEKSRAQILHSHFGNTGWGDLAVAIKGGVKHIVTFYGVDVNKLPVNDARWLHRYRDLFANVAKVLCEGPHMADCLADLGCPREKIAIHHLGVRISRIRFAPRQWTGNRPIRVLMCASFVEKKGLPYALEALAEFGREAPFEATLIGDSDGLPEHEKEKQVILKIIKTHGLADRVRLRGYQPYERVIEEAYAHDVFLSPSVTGNDGDTEGGAPVTIVLMAATGMPVVSTFHCDIPEIVPHETCARLAPERDPAALAGHLRWLCENPNRWQDLTWAARDRMAREFDCERQGAKLSEIYRALV